MRAAAREGYATATDLADYLVRKGMPFRDAHEAVARAVRHAEAERRDLAELPLAELQRFAPQIGDDVFAVLTLEGSVASRDHPGGTAPAQVRAAIAAARARSNRQARRPAIGPHRPRLNHQGACDGTRRSRVSGPGRDGLSDGRTSRARRTSR